ncbi:MAG: NFACT family protein, partial [Lactobacillus iners]|nr:NFACT family protein [Lactobacillus iners]
MNIDSITLQVITNELREALIGGQISKIYQPDIRTLYFRIFNTPKTYHLIITLDITPRIYLSSVIPPMPDMPSALCMFLRKYYENGRIASIEQLYLDRLLSIDIDILNAAGKLITRTIQIELMGKYSNVIFTENNIILEALIKTKRNTTALRTIAPKEPYG